MLLRRQCCQLLAASCCCSPATPGTCSTWVGPAPTAGGAGSSPRWSGGCCGRWWPCPPAQVGGASKSRVRAAGGAAGEPAPEGWCTSAPWASGAHPRPARRAIWLWTAQMAPWGAAQAAPNPARRPCRAEAHQGRAEGEGLHPGSCCNQEVGAGTTKRPGARPTRSGEGELLPMLRLSRAAVFVLRRQRRQKPPRTLRSAAAGQIEVGRAMAEHTLTVGA